MVTNGRRRAALPAEPKSTSRAASWNGFFLECHQISKIEMPDHWIPCYVLGLQFLRGITRRSFLDEGKHIEDHLECGACSVVGPREVRRFRMESEGAQCFLSIEPVVLQEMTADSGCRSPLELIRPLIARNPVLTSLLLRLHREVDAGSPGGRLFSESLCTRIAEEVVQRYSIGKTHLDVYKGGLSGARSRLAADYIDEHLSEDLDAGSIAAAAGLSKYHFGKAFKESSGTTLHRYVLARRMHRAQRLLSTSDLSLAEVAAASGFSDQSHLTVLFSRRFGVSPRIYRERARRISVYFRTNAAAFRDAPGSL